MTDLRRDPDWGWYRYDAHGVYVHRHWTFVGGWLAERRARRGRR